MIDFTKINKSFGEKDILRDATFRINPGERVGIVGPNGAGKSTIFYMILDEMEPDSGTISLPKNMRISCLRQQLEDSDSPQSLLAYTADAIPELNEYSARLHDLDHQLHEGNLSESASKTLLHEHGTLQHRFEQLGGYTIRTDAATALSGLGFKASDMERPLKDFSGGWQMRAGLARTLIAHPDILLLDEPSNYLDIPAVEWLFRFLKGFHGTLLLISHDRFLLKSLTNITLEINNGITSRYPGDFDYYRRERENRILSLVAARKNQDKQREQLERSIERFRSKNTKASQVQSWIRQLERMEDIHLPQSLHYSGTITLPQPPKCGSEMARLDDVSFSYGNSGFGLKNLSLQINRGDKIAVVGYNGTGKTTLLKLLAGALKPNHGKLVPGHNVITGYQAQEFGEILPPEESVYDVVRAALPRGGSENSLRKILGVFGFSGDDISKPCSVISGGEKIRLCFARLFVNPPNFLILDEPTTHLDLSAREALQQALKEYHGSFCLVSHDIEFVRGAAETIIAMQDGGFKKYYGNYQYYLEKTAAETPVESAVETNATESSASSQKARRRERAEQRAALNEAKKKAQRHVDQVESRMEELETEKAELTEQMGSGEDVDFAQISRRLKDIVTTLGFLTEKWEYAATELEEILEENRRIHD
jgi:ATP-binding cassette, subfamily F, member 3